MPFSVLAIRTSAIFFNGTGFRQSETAAHQCRKWQSELPPTVTVGPRGAQTTHADDAEPGRTMHFCGSREGGSVGELQAGFLSFAEKTESDSCHTESWLPPSTGPY